MLLNSKYTKQEFPRDWKDAPAWVKLTTHHNFYEWNDMAISISELVGSWDGVITYEHYSKWYDIYYSPLYNALKEEE